MSLYLNLILTNGRTVAENEECEYALTKVPVNLLPTCLQLLADVKN